MGTPDTKTLADKWTVVTADGKPSVHCEHTVAVLETGPEILTLSKAQKERLKVKETETVAA
jgi:methionyl aminopeptidase